MDEEEGECVQAEADVCQVQDLELEAAGRVPGLGLLRGLVDAGEVPHPEVSHRGRAPDPELPQLPAGVADHAEGVVGAQAAEVQAHEVGEAGQAVRDEVEVVLQQLLAVSDVIMLTLHRRVIQP